MICQASRLKMAGVENKAACWLSGSPPVLHAKGPLTRAQQKAVILESAARRVPASCWVLLLTLCPAVGQKRLPGNSMLPF